MREIDLKPRPASELPTHTFMIYGDTRTGKTTWAGTMPRPLFLSDISEKGYTSLDEENWNDATTPRFEADIAPIVWGIEKQSDMAEAIDKATPLIKAGRICSIVIDSASFYADLYLNIILMAQKTRDNRKAYDELGVHLRNVRIQLHGLGVNVAWLALSQSPDFDDEGKLRYKGKPMIPGKQADKFMAGVDFILRATTERMNPNVPPTFPFRTKEYASYIAGNRLGGRVNALPDPFTGTYAKLMQTIGYDIDQIRAALPKIGEIPKIVTTARPTVAQVARPVVTRPVPARPNVVRTVVPPRT